MPKIRRALVLKANAPLTITKPYQQLEPKVTPAYQRQIDKCLNCTKPAKECKEDCK